jgi:glycosyltransferase involved in cell wall biosynthesis
MKVEKVKLSQVNKKLIYILNSYSKNESSHFFHVLHLLSVMAKRGIDIVLLIEKANDIPVFEESNIKVVTLKNKTGVKRFVELYQTVANLNEQGYNRTYIRISSVTALVASFANKLNGGMTFFWQSGTTIEWDLEQPLNLKKIKWYITSYFPGRAARKSVDYFVTGPESMADYYESVAGVQRNKIKVLYNDINIGRFSVGKTTDINLKQQFLSEHDFSPNSLVLLLVHRLSPVRKTTMYFPHCLDVLVNKDLLKNVVVIVAGGGGELEPIKLMAQKSGVYSQCVFLGNVANSEIQQLYTMSDVFLHPTYNEGFPRVILEAMAASLPIVSTDAGGTSELVGVKQKYFVSPKDDINSFCENLALLVEDEECRKKLAVENRQHVKMYSTDKIAEMYERVIFDENA